MGLPFFLLLSSLIFSSLDPTLSAKVNSDLIHQTCKKTKHYKLCISSLQSDPSTAKSDTKDLAIIMARVGMANADSTSSYLSSQMLLQSGTNGTLIKKVMKECGEKYSFANEALQTAVDDLGGESYDYAYMHVMAAKDYPNACHNAFKRYPHLVYPTPLVAREDALKSICEVILGIIDAIGF